MTCSGLLAQAWEFAAFWCVASYASRIDNSGGAGNLFLTDSMADFVTLGVRANVGMVLYNVTQGTSGAVTAVTINTITATGVTWDDGDQYRIATITAQEIATIEMYLRITASDVYAALAAQAACDCTWQSWVTDYLSKINIIEAGAFYSCPCGQPRINNEMKNAYIEWANLQLENLRSGKVPVCVGDTAPDYPAIGWAEISQTLWSEAEISLNYQKKNLP